MQLRSMQASLEAAGAVAQTAEIQVAVHDPADRVKRAAVGFAAGLGLSLVALPIPIVHLVLVPGGLLLGIGLGLRRLTQGETFRGAEGRCPFCGTEQRFTLVGRARLPKRVYCSACQRELYLEDDKR